MSRGIGTRQRRILGVLSGQEGMTLTEIQAGLYGTKTVPRARFGRVRQESVPVGNTGSTMRALRGLCDRGLVTYEHDGRRRRFRLSDSVT